MNKNKINNTSRQYTPPSLALSKNKTIRKRIVRKGNGKLISTRNLIVSKEHNKKEIKNQLKLISINIRKGFVDKAKQIYKEIKKNKVDIVLLQEVGLNKVFRRIINKMFPGFLVYTNLISTKINKITYSQLGIKRNKIKITKRGVAILINREFEKNCTIKKLYKDEKARSLFLQIITDDFQLNLGNIYAPAEGKKKNNKWLNTLLQRCKNNKFKKGELLIGGDWNVKLNKCPNYFYNFTEKLNLYDLAFEKGKEKISTFEIWKKNKKIKKRLDGWFGTQKIKNKLIDIKINKNSDIYSDHKPVYITLKWTKENDLEEKEDEILKISKRIKKIVKYYNKNDWQLYKDKVEKEFYHNRLNWNTKFIKIEKNKNINELYKIVEEGGEIMKNILFSSPKGKYIIKKEEIKKKKFYDVASKKVRGFQKRKIRLLKLRNLLLQKLKNKTISKKGLKLLNKLKTNKFYSKWNIENIPNNSDRKNRKLCKWIKKSLSKVEKKEKKKKQIWIKDRKRKTFEENNKLFTEDTKYFMNKFIKCKNQRGRIHKISDEIAKKFNIENKNNINEYVEKYFTELFNTKGVKTKTEKIWDKFYINQEENIKNNFKLIKEINMKELQKVLRKLKNGKTGGIDGMVNEMIKYSGDNVKNWLLKIYNICLKIEKIPEEWKISLMRMLKKDANSDQNNASNYRGIALLPIIYKIYSTIITNRLYSIVEENNLIGELQFGFRKNKSTKQAIRILNNIIEDAKDNDKEVWITFLDIQKAYDTVEFWALQEILENFGINYKLINIIMNMNTNLKCKVVFENTCSNEINIRRGLRQGCPLSPLLFLLFLEPLFKWIINFNKGYKLNKNNKKISIPYTAFADDIALYTKNKLIMNKFLEMCNLYLQTYNMNFNFNKSVATSTCKNKGLPLMWNENTKKLEEMVWINNYETFKYLGIDISLDLNWEDSINRIKNKVNYRMKKIQNTKVDSRIKVKMINTIIIPTIAYILPFINNDKQLIQWDLQIKKYTKRILRISNRSSTALLQKSIKNGGLNLKSIYNLQSEILIEELFNILNFEEKTSALYLSTIIRLEEMLEKFNIDNINKCNKIKYWNKTNFIERTLSKLQELGKLNINTNNKKTNFNLLFGEIEIKNDHIGLIGKLIRNNIFGLEKIVKDGKFLSRLDINNLLNKFNQLSVTQYKILQSLICIENSNTVKPKLIQYIKGHNWYSSWLEEKISNLRKINNIVDINYIERKNYNIYTDGSRKENNLAGGVWTIEENNYIENFKISDSIDINDAEAIALSYGCIIPEPNSIVNLYIDNNNIYKKAKNIIHNNWNNIDRKKDGNFRSMQILEEIIKLRRDNHKIKFNIFKIKAHIGIFGNEKADLNAKKGLNSDFNLITSKDWNSYNSAVHLINNEDNKIINNLFRKNIKIINEQKRFQDEKSLKNKDKLFNKINEKEYDEKWSYIHTNSLLFSEGWFRLIYRIRENNLPNALEMKNRNDKNFSSSMCKICNEEDEDNVHLFLKCKNFKGHRTNMKNKVYNLLESCCRDSKVREKIKCWFLLENDSEDPNKKLAGIAGYIPKEVTSYIKDKVEKRKVKIVMEELSKIIANEVYSIWRSRNKELNRIIRAEKYQNDLQTNLLLGKLEKRREKRKLKQRKNVQLDKEKEDEGPISLNNPTYDKKHHNKRKERTNQINITTNKRPRIEFSTNINEKDSVVVPHTTKYNNQNKRKRTNDKKVVAKRRKKKE